MIWILATRGAATKLRSTPFTETAIEGAHSVVYRPGVEPVRCDGGDGTNCPLGEYERGLHRAAGVVYAWHGGVAESLFEMAEEIDLVIRYRGSGEKRKRTLKRVLFLGDALVTFPNLNTGRPALIGVPFRLQIPEGDTLADAIVDEVDAAAA